MGGLERVLGIEPRLSAWEAEVLPLNYTRTTAVQAIDIAQFYLKQATITRKRVMLSE